MPDTVNPQVTDSITQVNTEVVALSPAVAMSNVYVASAQALSAMMQNTTAAQGASTALITASTQVGVAVLGKLTEQVTG